jgi:hypothetical protein
MRSLSPKGHGYLSYTYGCRCATCRQGKADYMRERRAAARQAAEKHTQGSDGLRPKKNTARAPGATRFLAPDVTHGTRYAYEEHGCRCFDCTDARRASDNKYRKKAS